MLKYNLDKKDVKIEKLAEEVLSDNDLLNKLMEGILSKDNTIRQNSFKTLEVVSEEKPEILYLNGIIFLRC